ncbi:phytanoyl-CoA dioxygenase family protein [Nocardia brasiliensis]|uniref:phytanoyl-CoA dioxygenase family protein n=1 Tax=Nocardia brasiliensis TaxID=37326 RepID=UPI002454014E|nr:phytanoyl-CoA dioxygenase family protein [Nocardia brasiliensis]
MLDAAQITAFIQDGFIRIPSAFPPELARQCREIIWPDTGCDPDDPATWTEPLVRMSEYDAEPFRSAVRMPVLERTFDQLVGPGRWVRRSGLGSIPIRFPHADPPADDYWHFEGSYLPAGWRGHTWTNYRSRGRALLMLFLLSDVTEVDAPTRIRVGSHLFVPRLLLRYGEAGIDATRIEETGVLAATADLPLTCATGSAGDVYLCHPFLIHAAQAHRGTTPRFLAQPALAPAVPLELDRADGAYSPVERAIRIGLGRPS